jgi:uncharacterized protein
VQIQEMKRHIAAISIAALFLVLGLVCGTALKPTRPHFNADSANKTPLLERVPDVQQSTDFSCGAAALQAVLGYWGIHEQEPTLMHALHTNEISGTTPENIIRVARDMGLEAYSRENLDLASLEEAVHRIPVICAIQAWPISRPANFSWNKCWEEGHYVIVIGIDKQNVYVEDPSLFGTRGFIPREEFLERWHDYEGEPPLDKNDRLDIRLGIFIAAKNSAGQPHFTRVD